MLDIALLVPFQPYATSWIDPIVRVSHAESKLVALRARDELLDHLGFSPEPVPHADALRQRSLASVVLATSLERAGLAWRVLDPGPVQLWDWRRRLEALRSESPRLVGISSTFVNDGHWLASLCALVRKILPAARIAVGGYFYATDAKQFLSLDADVLCVGEGEVRIVQITQAVRDGRRLDGIPGLYLRDAQKDLRYTGDVEPLRLDELPLPDWSLSKRVDPPIDPELEPISYHAETQRGCVFKCEFCTFRTLAAPVLSSVERGVAAIRNVPPGRGNIWLIDATASYPRDRWRRVLERLIEEGGSPLPLCIFARVTDLDEEVCALMARAGVTYALIGQESGDQRILNAMRKGTRVEHLRPAIAALARNGIEPALSFMYGFPGETEESLATTRRLLVTINDGYESEPPVQRITLQPFAAQDFAGVRLRGVVKADDHRYGWADLAVSPQRAAEEALLTYLELSRIPHAPITTFDGILPVRQLFVPRKNDDRLAFFRWAKAIDRGIGIFVERRLSGRGPDGQELRALRAEIVSRLPPELRAQSRLKRTFARLGNWAKSQVMQEWVREPSSGVGPLTRLALGLQVGRETRDPEHAVFAIREGRYPPLGTLAPPPGAAPERALAEKLIALGISTGKRRLARAG